MIVGKSFLLTVATGALPRVAAAALVLLTHASLAWNGVEAEAGEARTIAFLGVHLQNDNAAYEPTSDAERARMVAIETQFKARLESSGRFRFINVPPDLKARIASGQAVGACGGCELTYGKELGSQLVAWINVQKVSNLILNMTVYMADVATGKVVFVRSVDMRGNTDESWTRSIRYLVKNYLLPSLA